MRLTSPAIAAMCNGCHAMVCRTIAYDVTSSAWRPRATRLPSKHIGCDTQAVSLCRPPKEQPGLLT